MQGNTRSSGVQSFPKSGQPSGANRPDITSPQRQAVGASAAPGLMSKIFDASQTESYTRNARTLASI